MIELFLASCDDFCVIQIATQPSSLPKPQLRSTNQNKEASLVNFKANEKVVGLSIIGIPGSRGVLEIQRLLDDDRQERVLAIAFMLAPCLWGFKPKYDFRNGVLNKVKLKNAKECL